MFDLQKIVKIYRKRKKSISKNPLFINKTEIKIRPVNGEGNI